MATSSRVARNFMTTLATQLVSWSLTFLVIRYVPAYLRGPGLAALSIATAFSMAFAQLVSLGTNSVLVKEVARTPGRTLEFVAAAAAARLPLTVLAFVCGLGIARLLHYDLPQMRLIALAFCVLPIVQLNEVVANALQGLEDFPRFNLATLAERISFSAIQISLVWFAAPLWMFALTGGVSGLLGLSIATIGLMAHRHRFEGAWRLIRPRLEVIRSLVRAGLPLMVGMIFFGIWEPGNKILLSKLADTAAVSWFEVAKRLAGTTMFLPAALAGVLLPVLTRQYHEDVALFEATARRLFRVVLICAVPFSAVLILTPGRILDLLHYPPEFRGSVPVLQVLGGGIVLWYVSQVAAITLVAMDRQSVIGRIGMGLAFLCLPICAAGIWLGHHLPMVRNGALGAMVADIGIESWMLRCYLKHLPAGIFGWRDVGILLRALVAAAPMALLFALMPTFREFYIVLPGVVLFPVLCVLLRCVDAKDMDLLRAGLRRRRVSSAEAAG